MAETGNREVLQSMYDAFARGDVPFVLERFDPEVEWTEPDGLPYGGTYRGPEEVLNGVFMRLGTEWDGFQVAPDELVGDGGSIVVLGHLSGTYKATGKSFRAPFAHAWKFREGKVVRFAQYTNTVLVQQALQP
jgi:ketosteroid isomerase-like protein